MTEGKHKTVTFTTILQKGRFLPLAQGVNLKTEILKPVLPKCYGPKIVNITTTDLLRCTYKRLSNRLLYTNRLQACSTSTPLIGSMEQLLILHRGLRLKEILNEVIKKLSGVVIAATRQKDYCGPREAGRCSLRPLRGLAYTIISSPHYNLLFNRLLGDLVCSN